MTYQVRANRHSESQQYKIASADDLAMADAIVEQMKRATDPAVWNVRRETWENVSLPEFKPEWCLPETPATWEETP